MSNTDRATEGICLYGGCDTDAVDGVNTVLCEKHLKLAYASFLIHQGTEVPEAPTENRIVNGNTKRRGTIYYARVGDLVKIGWTNHPDRRFQQLQADAVLFTYPGNRDDERAEHARWDHLRVRGREWFQPDAAMNLHIRRKQSRAA